MPGFYTHAKFGGLVLQELAPEVRREVEKYPELFFIGLQGPDILFYHKAYKSNFVSKTGHAQHDKPGTDFFEPARKIIAESQNKEAAFSYIAGFICHFTLDIQCHPYIIAYEKKHDLLHTEIETEEDRYLMNLDGKDYLRHIEADKVAVTNENAEVISWFFQSIERKDVKTALRYVKIFNHMFCAPGKLRRSLVMKLLKVAGQYDPMRGMIVNYEENQACHESTIMIAKLMEEAIPIASRLIGEYQLAVDNFEEVLDDIYLHTFVE